MGQEGSPSMKVLTLLNPLAGSGRALRIFKRIRKFLSSLNSKIVILKPSKPIKKVFSKLDIPDYFVVIGGDGTVRSVIEAMIYCNHVDSIIVPYLGGSGGELSHYAGILTPKDLEIAFSAGIMRKIDVFKASVRLSNGEEKELVFAANLQIGHFALGIKETPAFFKRLFGSVGYMHGVLKAVIKRVNKDARVQAENFFFSGKIYTIHFGNVSTTRGGVPVAPLARPNDGKIDMMLAKAIGRIEALKTLPRVLRGEHLSHPAVVYKQFSGRVVIELENDHVAIDGEYLGLAKKVEIEFLNKVKILCRPNKG